MPMSIKKACFLWKKCTLTQSAESGIFCCYSQLEEPSNYSARIAYVDLLNIKASPLKILRIACEVQNHPMIEAQVEAI